MTANAVIVHPAIVFSEDEIAKLTGIAGYDLHKYQPAGMGSPGHFFLNAQSRMIYTWRGVEVLAYGLQNAGKSNEAELIRLEMKIRREKRGERATVEKPRLWYATEAGGMA